MNRNPDTPHSDKIARAQVLRKLVADEFGIRSDKELKRAIEKMENPNIGIFVTPLEGADASGTTSHV